MGKTSRQRSVRYRHLRRTLIALLATLGFMIVLGLLAIWVLESRLVRQQVRLALQRGAPAFGADLQIGDLHWTLLPPQMQLQQVVIDSSGLHLEVEQAAVDLAGVRILSRTVELGTVALDGVRLRVTGLPKHGSSIDSWLGLRVRHLDVRRFELEGSSFAEALTIAMTGASLAVNSSQEGASGFAAVESFTLGMPGLQPFGGSAEARFLIDDDLQMPKWRMNGVGFDLLGSAIVSRRGSVNASAQGSVNLSDLDSVVRTGELLGGDCSLQVSFNSDARDWLQAQVRAPQITVSGLVLEELRAHLTLGPNRLDGTLEHALYQGGVVRGAYNLTAFAAPCPHHVWFIGDGVGLAGLLEDLGVPAAGLAARGEIRGELQWSGNRLDQGQGEGWARLEPAAGECPVRGRLDVRLTPDGLLHFAANNLALGNSIVQWQGPLTVFSWQPAWSVRASPAQFGELVPLVNAWIGKDVLPPVGGTGDLEVSLAGPWQQLQTSIRLDAHGLTYPPAMFDRVVAEATISPGEIRLGPVRWRIGAGDGEVEGTINWGDRPSQQRLDLDLRGRGLPLGKVVSWFGGPPVEGSFAFAGGVRGELAVAHGSWALGLTEVAVAGLPLGDGSATLDLAERTLEMRGIDFSEGLTGSLLWAFDHGEIAANLRWPTMPMTAISETAALIAGATSDVTAQFNWARDKNLTGNFSLNAEGAQIRAVALPDSIAVEAAVPNAATATATLERQPDGGLSGHGKLELLAAEHLMLHLLPEVGLPVAGHGSAEFSVDWPAQGLPRLSGRTVELKLDLEGQPVRLLEEASFFVSPNQAGVEGVRLSLLGEEVFVSLAVAADGSLRGRLAGTLDALPMRFLLPEWEPAGQIVGDLEILGTVGRPRAEGTVEVRQGSFRLPATSHVVSGIDGKVLLAAEKMTLDGLDFRFMHGRGRCQGRILVAEGDARLLLDGSVVDLDLPLLPGLEVRLGGDWRLTGPVDDLELWGDLQVDRVSLRRTDDVATILADWLDGSRLAAAQSNLRLDLHLEAERSIEARSPYLQLEGSASLDLTGTPRNPGVAGKIELHEGSKITFQGARYDLERATVTFSDPTHLDPFVDLQARAWVQSHQVTVRLSGSFDRLVPVLSSDPPLPEAEIISLLAYGHRSDTLGGSAMGSGAVGVGLASTLLTREINAELERRARLVLPVDQIRLDPFAESSTGNPAARITMVKQLSSTWSVMVQSNISSNREEVVVSRWSLGPGIYLEATRDLDGTYAVDLKLRRRY